MADPTDQKPTANAMPHSRDVDEHPSTCLLSDTHGSAPTPASAGLMGAPPEPVSDEPACRLVWKYSSLVGTSESSAVAKQSTMRAVRRLWLRSHSPTKSCCTQYAERTGAKNGVLRMVHSEDSVYASWRIEKESHTTEA